MIRTVIVDDEPLARLRLRTLLSEHTDFSVIAECSDGPDALAVIARERPGLVFLDVQMAEMNGVEVARLLERSDTSAPAVVFVTAYDQYALRAFEVHALDYLLKPFDEDRFVDTLERVRRHAATSETRETHERLLLLLRDLGRGAMPGAPEPPRTRSVLRLADLEVDVRARLVRRSGTALALRPKEFDLFVALLKRAGEVVSRRDLLHEVWGYSDDVVSRTIDTHIAELRRKLDRAPGQPGHITTVARAGYRLQV
jgi:two-component system LytT family response regulator